MEGSLDDMEVSREDWMVQRRLGRHSRERGIQSGEDQSALLSPRFERFLQVETTPICFNRFPVRSVAVSTPRYPRTNSQILAPAALGSRSGSGMTGGEGLGMTRSRA